MENKTLSILLSAGLLLIGHQVINQNFSLIENAPTASTYNTEILNNEWQNFSSTAGGFAVSIPDTPTKETQTLNTAVGPIDNYLFQAQKDSIYYVVGYADYPENFQQIDAITLLDNARDGAIANVQGRLLSELIIFLQGYPGREIRVEVPGEIICISRLYQVHNRMYMLIATTSKDNAFSPDIRNFLDSFQLVDGNSV